MEAIYVKTQGNPGALSALSIRSLYKVAKVFRLNTHRNLASLRGVNPRVRSLYKLCWCDACLTVSKRGSKTAELRRSGNRP